MISIELKPVLKILAISIVSIFIISYSLFEFRGIIQGPIVKVTNPKEGEVFKESLITLEGTTKNISFLNLNDYPLSIDDKGVFKEKLLLSPGYNIIKLKSEDRFGREKVNFLELMYN